MCVNLTFYPLVEDVETGKKRVVFQVPYTLQDYNDLKKIRIEAKQEVLFNRFKLTGITNSDRFIKLVQIPCGSCSECLNSKAKAKTFRIMKEASFHSSNFFITLTYDDDHLPFNGSLVKDEISKFNKKLKVYLSRAGKKSDFRFYGVGEYGGQTARPHYHVIYFGLELDDLDIYSKNEFGQFLYNSKFMSDVWSKGHVVIGEVDIRSAAYVARYCEKKQGLTKQDKEDFLKLGFVPEFSVQSMRPGIGADYLNKVVVSIKNQCYNENIKGTSFSFPKYYMDKVKNILEYSPELLAYENYTNLLSNNRYTSLLLAYGNDYQKHLNFIESEKKRNKRKRGN